MDPLGEDEEDGATIGNTGVVFHDKAFRGFELKVLLMSSRRKSSHLAMIVHVEYPCVTRNLADTYPSFEIFEDSHCTVFLVPVISK